MLLQRYGICKVVDRKVKSDTMRIMRKEIDVTYLKIAEEDHDKIRAAGFCAKNRIRGPPK
jgi:hypothetical protein